EFILWSLRGRERGDGGAGQIAARGLRQAHGSIGHLARLRRWTRWNRTEGLRSPGRAGIERGIERMAGPDARSNGWRRGRCALRAQRICGASRAFGAVALLLHVTDLVLELLVAELKLLDDPGELADLGLQALDAQQNVGATGLRSTLHGWLCGSAIAAQALA